jgi:hypothetical protein
MINIREGKLHQKLSSITTLVIFIVQTLCLRNKTSVSVRELQKGSIALKADAVL